MTTLWPAFRSSTVVWLPMKPSPPVTSTYSASSKSIDCSVVGVETPETGNDKVGDGDLDESRNKLSVCESSAITNLAQSGLKKCAQQEG